MKTKSKAFVLESEVQWEQVAPGIKRQIMGYDGQLMAVKVVFDKGVTATEHAHFHSQVTYVVSGKYEVHIGTEVATLSAGDSFYIEPDVMHYAKALEAGILIDTFSPHREDFLKK